MMSSHFSQVLEAVCQLNLDQQRQLIELVTRRLAEQGREQIAASVAESHQEHAQ